MNKQEESILQALIAGKEGAFASLYNLYVDELYSYGTRFCPDKDIVKDAIQDMFCYIYSHPEKLHGVTNLKSYLFRSLKNKILDYYKSKHTVRLGEEYDVPEFNLEISVEDTFIDTEEKRLTARRVEKMLETLSPQQKEAIYLRYFKGLEYKEIAEMLNNTEVVVRKSVSRGIEKLKKSHVIPIIINILSCLELITRVLTNKM